MPGETTTNLGYRYADCPADGQYVIINRSDTCFGSTWHHVKDHTGDENGYFMLVNASTEPSSFYIQTIDGLCSGTTFRFAVWIVNMCNYTNSIRPNITMTIERTDGTLLSSYSTGDIPVNTLVPEWKEYGFNFTTPVGVSTVVLRMRNNAPGGYGNDVGLDDITFRSVGPAITVFSKDIAEDTTLLCVNDTRTVHLQSNIEACYFNTAYQWQISTDNGDSWTNIEGANSATFDRSPTPAGTYLYRLAVAQQSNIGIATCQTASRPIALLVYEPDVRTIRIEQPANALCENTPAIFRAKTTYAGKSPSFQWYINEQEAGNNDSVLVTSDLKTGDVVNCIFTSSLACNSPASANSFPVSVLKQTFSTISHSMCEGESFEGYTASGSYKDVFTGSNGCDSTRTLNLTVFPKEHTQFDTTICFGTTYQGLTREGTYQYIYQSVHGCDSVHTIVLHVLPDIFAKPYRDTILCAGDSLVLTPDIPFDSYVWQDGYTGSNYPVRRGGTYRVVATNKCGTATKTTVVEEKICNLDFPTAFTPNNDGRNDRFRVVNAFGLSHYHCIVFSRWGQKVFETTDPAKGWDGLVNARPADKGTYIYWCEYERNGKPGVSQLRGTITLIR